MSDTCTMRHMSHERGSTTRRTSAWNADREAPEHHLGIQLRRSADSRGIFSSHVIYTKAHAGSLGPPTGMVHTALHIFLSICTPALICQCTCVGSSSDVSPKSAYVTFWNLRASDRPVQHASGSDDTTENSRQMDRCDAKQYGYDRADQRWRLISPPSGKVT